MKEITMNEQASFVSLNPIQPPLSLGFGAKATFSLLLFSLSLLIYIFKKKDKIRYPQILNNEKQKN